MQRAERGWRVLEGELEPYHERGMERLILFALRVPGLHRPVLLDFGRRLTVYAPDGGVLWSGTVDLVPRRWWRRHRLPFGVRSPSRQRGVPYRRWMAWFCTAPPLRARLETPPPAGG